MSEPTEEAIHGSLSDVILKVSNGSILLSRWLLVLETIGDDGKAVAMVRSPGTETWEALGMASAATEVLKSSLSLGQPEDNDEEDNE